MWQDHHHHNRPGWGRREDVVTIPFTECLEAESHTCKIPLPATIGRDKAERQFYLDYACLVPEYYSKQAIEYKMDPDIEDVVHKIKVEYKYNEKFAAPDAWTMSSKKMDMAAVLVSLNTYFDSKKPAGCKYPLIFFDWVNLDQPLSDMGPKEYYEAFAAMYHESMDDLSQVNNTLPASLNDYPIFLNQLKYPTEDSDVVQEKVRIRMHILPTASVAFSNETLVEALGFDVSNQIGIRIAKQYKLFGDRRNGKLRTMIARGPAKMKVEEGTSPVKVYSHLDILEGASVQAEVRSNLEKWTKAENVVSDINKVLSSLLLPANLDASLTYEEGQFGIKFSGKDKVTLNLVMEESLSKLLGYKGEKRVTPNTPSTKVSFEEHITDIEAKARTLVYDTRVVFVQLEENAGYTNAGVGEEVLATLLPVYDGTMTTHPSRYKSTIPVTALDKYIELGLYRYSESKEAIPLGWKVKAYFTGQLVGA